MFGALKSKTISWSLLALLFIAGFYFTKWEKYRNWSGKETPFYSDVQCYYSYLPAWFIDHDPLFKTNVHNVWFMPTPNGKVLPKTTMGLAFLYLPGFLTGHFIAKTFHYSADGFSLPYAYSIHFFGMLFFIIALLLLRKVLLIHFNEITTAWTILAITFGSNLFFYTLSNNSMSHNYLFFINVLLLYFTYRWQTSNYKITWWYPLAFLIGLSTVIRPTELLVILIPLLWGISTINSLKNRILYFVKENPLHLPWLFLLFLLPILPQLILWKIQTGHFLYAPYGDEEKFFLSQPHLTEFLFGFRKGWFIYSPLMFLSILGFYPLIKKMKSYAFGIIILISIMTYLLSSWWCWWFGGGFGMRAMVQYYAFLALPLAMFFQSLKNTALKIIFISVTFILCYLNTFQTLQFKNSLIHWDAMTYKAYVFSIGKDHYSSEEFKTFESLLLAPDYEAAMKGQEE